MDDGRVAGLCAGEGHMNGGGMYTAHALDGRPVALLPRPGPSCGALDEPVPALADERFYTALRIAEEDAARRAAEARRKDCDDDGKDVDYSVSRPSRPAVPKEQPRMWVDRHAPERFSDLLCVGDAGVSVLQWASAWRAAIDARQAHAASRRSDSPLALPALQLKALPEHAVLLLAGPPGIGKTSLVRAVARAAGFALVEVNASDERSGDSVVRTVDAALSSDSLMLIGSAKAPHMLFLDEVDGAAEHGLLAHVVSLCSPGATKSPADAPTAKSARPARPIICACNDLYAPALRSLRRIARVAILSPPPTADVARRLRAVWDAERASRPSQPPLDRAFFASLAEAMRGDVRACLHALQFAAHSAHIDAATFHATAAASFKDRTASVIDTLRTVFIRRPRDPNSKRLLLDGCADDDADVARLATGILELYPSAKYYDSAGFVRTAAALEALSAAVGAPELAGLAPSARAALAIGAAHEAFASATPHTAIRFPRDDAEHETALARSRAVLAAYRMGLAPVASSSSPQRVLATERAPYVSAIVDGLSDAKRFRIANPALLRSEERARLRRCAAVMLSEGLSFASSAAPVRLGDDEAFAAIVSRLDPPIDALVPVADKTVPTDTKESDQAQNDATSQARAGHDAAVRSMIAAEVARERIALQSTAQAPKAVDHDHTPRTPQPPAEPRGAALQAAYKGMHAGTRVAAAGTLAVKRDFFGRPIEQPMRSHDFASTQASRPEPVAPVAWFKYNEGFSRAVRRDISIRDLFKHL